MNRYRLYSDSPLPEYLRESEDKPYSHVVIAVNEQDAKQRCGFSATRVELVERGCCTEYDLSSGMCAT